MTHDAKRVEAAMERAKEEGWLADIDTQLEYSNEDREVLAKEVLRLRDIVDTGPKTEDGVEVEPSDDEKAAVITEVAAVAKRRCECGQSVMPTEVEGVAVGRSQQVGDSLVGHHTIIPPESWEEYQAAKATLETLHPDIGDREVMRKLVREKLQEFNTLISWELAMAAVQVIYDNDPKPKPKTLAEIIKATPFGDKCDYLLAEAIDELRLQLAKLTPAQRHTES